MNLIALNYVSLILVLTVFQGGLYSMFLLLGKQRSRLPSRLLGCLTLVFTLHFANILLIEFGPLGQQPNFNPVFGFFYGPLLLLFIRSLIEPHFTVRGTWSHFLAPAIAFVIVIVCVGWLHQPLAYRLLPVPVLIHLTVYLLVARRTLHSFKRDLEDQFSAIDKINLDWLSKLLNQTLFLLGLAIAHFVFQTLGIASLQTVFTLLIFVTVLYFINALVLKGMSHPSIDLWLVAVAPDRASEDFGKLRENGGHPEGGRFDADSISDDEDLDRYRGSGLSPEESRAQFERLRDLMEREEPFLDENLNILQLSEAMGVSSKHLSQVINQNADQNFYDFINGYRIEKAKTLLLDPGRTDLRVSEVMFEVGYTAKSTFNSLFKRFTGLTPTEFRRQKSPRS